MVKTCITLHVKEQKKEEGGGEWKRWGKGADEVK